MVSINGDLNPTCENLNRERLYQLRSKISLIESSMKWIKLNFSGLATEFKGKTAPPINYPFMIFQRMEQSIHDIWQNFYLLQNEEHLGLSESISCFDGIQRDTEETLKRIIHLQNLYEQRTAGLTLFDAVEKSHALFNEYSWVSKTYNAADVLSYELVKRSLGKSWIKKNSYVPVTLFSGENYQIDCYTLIVYMPYQDLFRIRYWPVLAHEVGHAFIPERMKFTDGPAMELAGLVLQYRNEIGQFFHETYFSNRPYGDTIQDKLISLNLGSKTGSQFDELCSDIIGTHLAGPAYLFSLCSVLCTEVEREAGDLAINTIFRSHPPIDLRFAAAMGAIRRNFDSVQQDAQSFLEEFQTFLLEKNQNVTSEVSQDFLARYCEIAEHLTDDLVDLLPRLGVKPFTNKDWKPAAKKFSKGSLTGLDPIQLLNIAWLKRIRKIMEDASLSREVYFDKRKGEPQLYEHIVEGLYSWYCKLPKGTVRS